MKKIVKIILTLLIAINLFGCDEINKIVDNNNSQKVTNEKLVVSVKKIIEYGNVKLDISASDFKEHFDPGDLVNVEISGATYVMPVGTRFSDVTQGEMVLRIDNKNDEVLLGISMGDFAETAGIEEGTKVSISMNTKEGYLDEYTMRHLDRSKNRYDYLHLTDEEFANFRVVNVGDIKDGVLYRSASPINTENGRAKYADEACKNHGIKAMINLADDEEKMYSHKGYPNSYYSTCNIVNIAMKIDFDSLAFKQKMAEVARFIINNEGPYLIHCTEGKDRTGYSLAIIEALMNASLEEIEKDYMITFENYYGIYEDQTIYQKIIDIIFEKLFANILNVDDLKNTNLSNAASDYFLSTGLTNEEVTKLKDALSK